MPQLSYDPAKYTSASRDAWSDAARAFADENAPKLEPYGLRMIEMLDLAALKPGARVLDLCSGPGEPALTIAKRLEGRATVVGTDLAPEMVRLANERAAGTKLANVAFEECDAQALKFEPASFDLVTCRFGLMLVAEPDRVAKEVERVLKKGGKFGFTTWAESSKTAPVWITRQVVMDLVPKEMIPPGPDIYRWGDPANLTALMDEADMAIRKIEAVKATWEYDSPDHYWWSMTRGSPTGRMLSKFPPEMAMKVEEESKRRLAKLASPDGRLRLDAEALAVVAQKGMT